MRKPIFSLFPFVLLVVVLGVTMAAEQTKKSNKVDKKADQLLRQMSDVLANAKTFTFRTKGVEERVRADGTKVAAEVQREVVVRRPNGVWVHASVKAPDQSRELNIWYDGKTISLQSDNEKVYARTKVPPTIDETLDYLGSTLNLPMPVGDVLYSSPYDAYMTDDTTAKYLKLTSVEGKSCHELSFQNPVLDYKIWVAEAEQSVPCKLEINYKLDYKSPKYSITFYDWNFAPQIAENRFTHEPPAGFHKIQIIGRVPLDEQPASKTETQTQEN
jgi:hypothetical protein